MANDGPYIDIYDDAQSAFSREVEYREGNTTEIKTPQVRLGKLDGLNKFDGVSELFPTGLKGYGLYADNVYLRGAIYATSGKIGSLSID
jgi:hypothetical protein